MITYTVEVSVNVLSGIKDLDAFCASGHVEYDEKTDKGRGAVCWEPFRFRRSCFRQELSSVLDFFFFACFRMFF